MKLFNAWIDIILWLSRKIFTINMSVITRATTLTMQCVRRMDNTTNIIFQLYLKLYNLIKFFKNIHSIHHIDALGLLPRPQLNNNSTNKNEMITSACAKLPLVVHVRPGVKKSSASSSSTWVSVVFTKSTGYWKSLLAIVSRWILDNPWCLVMNHREKPEFFHLGDGFKFEDRVT